MKRPDDDIGDFIAWAPWASLGAKLAWVIVVLGPVAVFASILGHPPTVLAALERVELSSTEDAKDPVTNKLAKTRDFNILDISAAVVVGLDAVWVYDLGPEIGINFDEEYPGEMFFMTLDEGRIRPSEKTGQYVQVLADHLEARRHNLNGLLGVDAEHRILFAIDKRVPFETTRALMYTAGQARYSDFSFVLQGAEDLRVQGGSLPAIGLAGRCIEPPKLLHLAEAVQAPQDSGHLTRETLRALGAQ